MAAMEEPLLEAQPEVEPGAGPRLSKGRRWAKASVAVLAALALCGTAVTLRQQGQAAVPQARQADLPTLGTAANDTAPVGLTADQNWLQCLSNTGGSCSVWHCHASRGPARCQGIWPLRECHCMPGYCSDMTGRCVRGDNPLIAQGIVFHNAAWPSYKIYVDWDGVYVRNERVRGDPAYKFNLYGIGSYGRGSNSVMVGSVKYPHYALSMEKHRHCLDVPKYSSDYHPGAQNCWNQWPVDTQNVDHMDMKYVARMHGLWWQGRRAVVFSSAKFPGLFWHIPRKAWTVEGVRGDPGPSGYWIPHPPLPPSVRLPRFMRMLELAANSSGSAVEGS